MSTYLKRFIGVIIMTDLMHFLYEYAQTHRVFSYTDHTAYQRAMRQAAQNLEVLYQALSDEQTQALENFQDFLREQHCLELEATFLASFSLARELMSPFGAEFSPTAPF